MTIDEKTRLLFASYIEGFKLEAGGEWNDAVNTIVLELRADPDEFNYRIRELDGAATPRGGE